MKLSIITAVYNREASIGRTIKSVQSQSFINVEHIIVDGHSTDGTSKIIGNLIDSSSKFISEKDCGIYDAINKGIKMSSGDIIGLLHSDDFYVDSLVLEKVAHQFLDPAVDIVYGDVSFFSPKNLSKDVRIYKSGPLSRRSLSWGWMPAHPAMFIKKSIYEKMGLYKVDYKIAADYEFLCRISGDQSISSKYFPEILVRMQMGGVSTSGLESALLLNCEVVRACRENKISTNFFKIITKYPLKIMQKWLL